jgi:hypothetical protein
MNVDFVSTPAIQNLLDRASGKLEQQGDARLKLILRDLLEAAMQIIVRHDVRRANFGAQQYLADGAGEIGLIIPALALNISWISIWTPRTKRQVAAAAPAHHRRPALRGRRAFGGWHGRSGSDQRS